MRGVCFGKAKAQSAMLVPRLLEFEEEFSKLTAVHTKQLHRCVVHLRVCARVRHSKPHAG